MCRTSRIVSVLVVICAAVLVSAFVVPRLVSPEGAPQTEDPRDAVVKIYFEDAHGHGTGFAIAPHLVVTNAHVARSGALPVLRRRGGVSLSSTTVALDEERDLAVIFAAPAFEVTLEPTCERPGYGDEVVAVGFPLAAMWARYEGAVASDRTPELSESTDYVVLDLSVNSGISGGPVLDRDGRVVGVVTATLQEPVAGTPLSVRSGSGLAIPGDVLCDFLREEGLL